MDDRTEHVRVGEAGIGVGEGSFESDRGGSGSGKVGDGAAEPGMSWLPSSHSPHPTSVLPGSLVGWLEL